MKLIDNGLKLSALRKSLQAIRRQLPCLEKAPLASKRLVTDGKTVFRYDPDLGVLESMDEFGQFAFWFGLGDEVQAVKQEVERMPKPVRYVRRTG